MQRHRGGTCEASPVRLRRVERLTRLERREAAHRELLILARAGGFPSELLGLELPYYPGRHASDERTPRHDEPGTHEARGADEGLLLHHHIVHDDGANPDQRAAAHRAT